MYRVPQMFHDMDLSVWLRFDYSTSTNKDLGGSKLLTNTDALFMQGHS